MVTSTKLINFLNNWKILDIYTGCSVRKQNFFRKSCLQFICDYSYRIINKD